MRLAADDISSLDLAGGSITVVSHARVRTVSDPSNKSIPARIASLSKLPNSPASAPTPSLEPPGDRLSGPIFVPFTGPMTLLNSRPARSAFKMSASSALWAPRILWAAWMTCFRRPGLMSPSTFRFATRLFFLGNASAPESIDIPDDLLLPENQWEPTALVRPALPKHSFPMSALRIAETTRHCPDAEPRTASDFGTFHGFRTESISQLCEAVGNLNQQHEMSHLHATKRAQDRCHLSVATKLYQIAQRLARLIAAPFSARNVSPFSVRVPGVADTETCSGLLLLRCRAGVAGRS